MRLTDGKEHEGDSKAAEEGDETHVATERGNAVDRYKFAKSARTIP